MTIDSELREEVGRLRERIISLESISAAILGACVGRSGDSRKALVADILRDLDALSIESVDREGFADTLGKVASYLRDFNVGEYPVPPPSGRL